MEFRSLRSLRGVLSHVANIDTPDVAAEALRRIKKAKIAIEYGPADEPWNVRRFFVRDPFGKLVNILMHL